MQINDLFLFKISVQLINEIIAIHLSKNKRDRGRHIDSKKLEKQKRVIQQKKYLLILALITIGIGLLSFGIFLYPFQRQASKQQQVKQKIKQDKKQQKQSQQKTLNQSQQKQSVKEDKSEYTIKQEPKEDNIVNQFKDSKQKNAQSQLYFPESGVTNIKPTRQVDLSARIDRQSLQIAKQYLKLGLKQPQAELIQRQKNHYQKKYRLQQTFQRVLNKVEFPFCIIIPSFKNGQNLRYMLPLVSILRQEYQNYHILYIDDASPDGTGQLVRKFTRQKDIGQSKLKLIQNEQNKGPLENQYTNALQYCKQQDIILLIDGDDGLVGTQSLKLLNHFYQTTDSWFVYANFIWFSGQSVGVSDNIPRQMIKNRRYRDNAYHIWCTSHPKSFYNMLFHKMNVSSLMDRNQKGQLTHFFRVNSDRAVVYPIVQMSETRIKYVEEILYIYLDQSPNSESKLHGQERIRTFDLIIDIPKQKKLDCLFEKTNCLAANQYLKQKIRTYQQTPLRQIQPKKNRETTDQQDENKTTSVIQKSFKEIKNNQFTEKQEATVKLEQIQLIKQQVISPIKL